MRPKTKLQKKVAGLMEKLPALTKTQINWVHENFFEHEAYVTKKEIVCLECGHKSEYTYSLLESMEGHVCEHCGRNLKIRQGKKRVLKDRGYFCIMTTLNNFQLLRFFMVKGSWRVGEPACYTITEVVQNWITEDGKVTVAAHGVSQSMYYDQWILKGKFEIRFNPYDIKYKINPYKIYPIKRALDVVKRNGFTGSFHDIAPVELITMILTDKRAETLLKAGQFSMLKYRQHLYCAIERFWPSIRICIRNGYKIKDASMWCDYIDLLRYFNKDLLNKKYVCPDNLKLEHDRYNMKKELIEQRQRIKEKEEKAIKDEKLFLEKKRRFFNLCISDDLIKITALKSISEFIKEGESLCHCVFTQGYYKKDNSLILSARIEDKRIETIEVDIKKMDIVQSRGLQNQNSEFHDRIVELVKSNMRIIRKLKNKPIKLMTE